MTYCPQRAGGAGIITGGKTTTPSRSSPVSSHLFTKGSAHRNAVFRQQVRTTTEKNKKLWLK